MLHKAFIFLFLLLLSNLSYSQQDSTKFVEPPKRAVYFEALGTALFYSVNYDQVFYRYKRLSLSGRLGLSYYPKNLVNNYSSASVPVEVNLMIGKGKYFEVGLAGLLHRNFKKDDPSNILIASLRLGYRNQKANGLMYRIGFTPLLPVFESDENRLTGGDYIAILPWVGFGVGYAF